jgi:arginase
LFGINDCHKPKKNYTFKKATFKRDYLHKSGQLNNYKRIILFPHHLGQTKMGSEKAPKYLTQYINKKSHTIKTVHNTGIIYKNINNLYKANQKYKENIINIGGDHSMAIATIADTLNKYPNAKVIYFDAHADLNTYKSSNSKHYHGMPLSFITGIDHDKRFSFIKNKLPFENLLYIGSRCWDHFEVNEAYKRKIKILTPDDINKHFDESLEHILNFVNDSPVHVSFDVDSIDPKYIPSTGTPVKNGIELKNAIKILDNVNKNIVKLDITELNMELGSKQDGIKSGKNTAKLFYKFIS